MRCVQALTKFLKSVNWKVPQEAKQALDLLNKWSPMDVDDALELLSPAFVNPAVRKYAVTRLQQADDEVCKALFNQSSISQSGSQSVKNICTYL